MTQSTDVSSDQSDRIQALVDSGLFADQQHVLNDALTLLEAKQERRAAKMKALLAAAQVGIDDIEAGRCETFHSPEALEARILELWDEAIDEVKAA